MHTNNFQCQHLWSLVGADGYRECLWCGEKLLHVPTTVSDNTKPLRPNTEAKPTRKAGSA